MRVRVDRDLCIATGNCVLTAPDVFDQDEDDGTVVVLSESIGSDQEDAVRKAVTLCPAHVISVED
jgi:ferredoxin